MKIYIDLILLINFIYDFIIVLTINIILKRNASISRIIISSIIGSLSIFIWFISINKMLFLLIKVLTITIMIIISFGYTNIIYTIKNIIAYYFISFILGGNLYYLSSKFHSNNVMLVFLLLFSPSILFLYVKQIKELKIKMNVIKKVKIFINNRVIELNGYIDTGNSLTSITGTHMVFISNSLIIEKEISRNNIYLVPFKTINSNGIIKCIKPNYVIVEDYGKFNNILIGYMSNKFNLENTSIILNKKIMEG